MDKQIVEKISRWRRIYNYAITNPPNDIIEVIFVVALNSSKIATETYTIMSKTC